MFDPFEAMFGGVQIIAVVFGLVEFIKNMAGLEGKSVTALSAILGAILYAVVQVVGVIPDPTVKLVAEIAIASVTFGLTASGYYKFVNARVPEVDEAPRYNIPQ